MSVESYIFVRDDRLPTVDQWQSGLNIAGINIVLDQIPDLRSYTGYLPAFAWDQQLGFEWYYGPVTENFDGPVPEGVGDRQHVIIFRTGGDVRELVCSLLAGAVLAQIADGLVFDEESGQVINGDAALDIARRIEAELW